MSVDVSLVPCQYKGCGVHARFKCGQCDQNLCNAHAKDGNDGKSYCPDDIASHVGEGH